jgi:hypothetical protein
MMKKLFDNNNFQEIQLNLKLRAMILVNLRKRWITRDFTEVGIANNDNDEYS